MGDQQTVVRAKTDPRVEEVCRVLHLQPRLGVAELASLVRLSPSRLRHVFKKQTGVAIVEYSLEVRLQHARVLLITTFLSIKEIRHVAGIPDATNFVRFFKKRFHLTPSLYRETFRDHLDQQIAIYTNETPLPPTGHLGFTARIIQKIER
jgi:transcriptional regulator GlxA family with amidase domain